MNLRLEQHFLLCFVISLFLWVYTITGPKSFVFIRRGIRFNFINSTVKFGTIFFSRNIEIENSHFGFGNLFFVKKLRCINSQIANKNKVKNLQNFFCAHSNIGSGNIILGDLSVLSTDAVNAFYCVHSDIIARHYFDCLGGVVIKQFSLVAGIKSHFWTHQMTFGVEDVFCDQRGERRARKFVTRKIIVAGESIIGSNATILPGSRAIKIYVPGGASFQRKDNPRNRIKND